MIGATRATGCNPSKFANETFKGNSFFLNKTSETDELFILRPT